MWFVVCVCRCCRLLRGLRCWLLSLFVRLLLFVLAMAVIVDALCGLLSLFVSRCLLLFVVVCRVVLCVPCCPSMWFVLVC